MGSAANTARIAAVDYDTNIITLETPLSWEEGATVNLAYAGEKPDLGIYEMGNAGRVSVQIDTQPFKVTAGESVTLTAIVRGAGNPVSYKWNFGDGMVQDAGSAVNHTYDSPGQYAIFCTVNTADEKVYKGCAYVIIQAEDVLAQPLSKCTFDDDDQDWEWTINTLVRDCLYDEPIAVEKQVEGTNGYLRLFYKEWENDDGEIVVDKDLWAEINPNEWNIDQYPIIKADYKIKPGTPVAMYVRAHAAYNWNNSFTQGYRIVYLASSEACNIDTPETLIADGEWHSIEIDARDIRNTYPDVVYANATGFRSPEEKVAVSGVEWYLDNFSIEPEDPEESAEPTNPTKPSKPSKSGKSSGQTVEPIEPEESSPIESPLINNNTPVLNPEDVPTTTSTEGDAGLETFFRDISGHWAEKGIKAWAARQLAGGYPDGTFRPDNQITRAEFFTLVNRAFNYPGGGYASYRDVTELDWFAAEFAKAAAVGYLGGYPDGTAKPLNPITQVNVNGVVIEPPVQNVLIADGVQALVAGKTITANMDNASTKKNKSSATTTYTLTYVAGANGSISGEAIQTVSHGGSGTEVTAVPDEGYHFVKWSDGVETASRTDSNVTGNITVTAEFAHTTYTVTFMDYDGTVLSTQNVAHGGSATAPENPTRDGYTFTDWDNDFTNITQDLTVTAQYSVNIIENEFTSTSVSGTTATFSWTAVEEAESLKIRQSTDGGETWTDAATFEDLAPEDTTAIVTGLTIDTPYCFKLVATGGVTPGETASINVTTADGYMFGAVWDSSTVSTDLTRLGDAVIESCFDDFAPWNGMKLCTVADNGTITSYLDVIGANNFKRKGESGQVMVEIPQFYYKHTYNAETKVHEFWVADWEAPGFKLHPAFERGTEDPKEYVYVGAYKASLDTDNKLASVSGAIPTTRTDITNFRNYAQARNEDGHASSPSPNGQRTFNLADRHTYIKSHKYRV